MLFFDRKDVVVNVVKTGGTKLARPHNSSTRSASEGVRCEVICSKVADFTSVLFHLAVWVVVNVGVEVLIHTRVAVLDKMLQMPVFFFFMVIVFVSHLVEIQIIIFSNFKEKKFQFLYNGVS
jgi:hypothetical protein